MDLKLAEKVAARKAERVAQNLHLTAEELETARPKAKKPPAPPRPKTPKLDPNDPVTKQLLAAIAYKQKYCRIETLFPDKGKLRRSFYKKHLLHFKQGAEYSQRLLMAGNRTGKTTAAGCELTYHLTGNYPGWWDGYRFNGPSDWYVAGKYSHTIRDILQEQLLGKVGEFGSGLIPKHLIDADTMTAAKKMETNITDFRVKHPGGWSTVGFRSYDQGRKAFEGTARSIWMDEEPPLDVYQECLMRTLTPTATGDRNILMITFTPLEGQTEVITQYLGEVDVIATPDAETGPGKWVTGASMWDVPHLDEKNIDELLLSYPEYQREARSKGIPQLGEGICYSVAVDQVFIDPIEIPENWKRVFALDFGWDDPTAIIWGALDPETEVFYIYHESYLSQQYPMVHAAIIAQMNKAAGFTIPGVCDPSGGGSSTKDGELAADVYRNEYKIKMRPAVNSIEPGITNVQDRMVRNKLKIFNTCLNAKKEYRLYHRDKKGRPVDKLNHIMDCLRYIVMSGIPIAKSLKQVKDARMAESQIYESTQLPEWSMWFGPGR